MSGSPYRATLFDLFGTLVHFDAGSLPEVVIDGRAVRSTLGYWAPLIGELIPGADAQTLGRALMAVSVELDRERVATCTEHPSRERFRRAVMRLGLASREADEVGPILARAHMRGIAEATRCPPEHLAVLEQAGRHGGGIAIITNFDDTATAYEILDRHGILRRVQTVVVSEAVGLRKPHPSLVRLALRDLGVEASAALMVGDNVVEDVGAAHAAGIDAAWIDTAGAGVPEGTAPPRYVVRALTEVARLFA